MDGTQTNLIPFSVPGDLVVTSVNHGGQDWPLCRFPADVEWKVRDLDFATWLGFQRARDIRDLIERYTDEIGPFSRYRAAKMASDGTGRGRPETGYLLSEDQALFLAAKSETAKANTILKAMIVVFRLVMKGELPNQPALLARLEEQGQRIAALEGQQRALRDLVYSLGTAAPAERPSLFQKERDRERQKIERACAAILEAVRRHSKTGLDGWELQDEVHIAGRTLWPARKLLIEQGKVQAHGKRIFPLGVKLPPLEPRGYLPSAEVLEEIRQEIREYLAKTPAQIRTKIAKGTHRRQTWVFKVLEDMIRQGDVVADGPRKRGRNTKYSLAVSP